MIDLVDGDLARFASLGLWNNNREDAILHGSLDTIMVDPRWKLESAVEASKATLGDPESWLGCLWLSDSLLVWFGDGRLLGDIFELFVLDCWLLVLRVWSWRCFLDFNVVLGVGLEALFGLAGDGQGVVVSPFDVDIRLLNSWEFAMEFVGLLGLLDVKPWCE